MNERKKLIPYKVVKKINIFGEEYVEIYHGEEYVKYLNKTLEKLLEDVDFRYKHFKNYDGDNLIEEGILYYDYTDDYEEYIKYKNKSLEKDDYEELFNKEIGGMDSVGNKLVTIIIFIIMLCIIYFK